MKRPILAASLVVAILGAIVALVAFLCIWPWAFLFGASAALIAGTNASYAWRYENRRRAIAQTIAGVLAEMPALGDLQKSITCGYTIQEVSQALAPQRTAQIGDSSNGINPCGYGELI